MVRYDIVGLSDCPHFAKAVKLGEKIAEANPGVEVHHEMIDKFFWKDFCDKMKRLRGWNVKKSPVVYEILVDPSGKALLIGDCDDFCEFAALYFDIYYDPPTSVLKSMALKNKNQMMFEDQGETPVFVISIYNAPLPLLELLIAQLLSPVSMLPPGALLSIRIYDETADARTVEGLIMEITDMASPVLHKAMLCSSLQTFLHQCNLLILAEDLSRKPTEEDRDWMMRVDERMMDLLGEMTSQKMQMNDCRILVGGQGPQCYIAEMLRRDLPYSKSGPGRIVAIGQHISQKAKNEISKLTKLPAGSIGGIHAWGWPGEVGAYIEVGGGKMKVTQSTLQSEYFEFTLKSMIEDEMTYEYLIHHFASDFLEIQKKILTKSVELAPSYMPFADAISGTVRIWLASEQLASNPPAAVQSHIYPDPADAAGAEGPFPPQFLNPGGVPEAVPKSIKNNSLPVLNAGVQCPPTEAFPEGTFMVQPSVCVAGKWQGLGLLSSKNMETVGAAVGALLKQRLDLIFPDRDPAELDDIFPDMAELLRKRKTMFAFGLGDSDDQSVKTMFLKGNVESLERMVDMDNLFEYDGEGEGDDDDWSVPVRRSLHEVIENEIENEKRKSMSRASLLDLDALKGKESVEVEFRQDD